MWHGCPYRLKSGKRQEALRDFQSVDRFNAEMLAGRWKWEELGHTFIYWRHEQIIYIAEGHHRANAALEIGKATGDWSFLELLLEHGRRVPDVPHPSDIHRLPTRTLWSRVLSWLDL